jgi:diguanylate cyclase (GGDEF)-like protein/PAS domain S-box-containing protein
LLFVPFLLWAAFRFHPRETAVFMLILPAAAIRGTLHGFGPFVRGTPHESLLLSQLLLGVTGIMTLAVSASVSERKRLEEMAAHLAAIVETSSDAIIGKTLEGVIVSWNRGAERIFGYSSAQAIGRPISILSPPGSAEELPRVLESLRRGENVQPYETIRCRKDGSLVNVSITVSPVCDARGRVTGYSAISRDITAHLQAERAMREANERLQASFSELERKTGEIALLNQMSHLLQSCQAEEEVWAVIRQYAARFFLGDSGAVYVLNAPANLLGAVAVWGEFPPEEQVFSMGDCWALRAGRVHSVSHPWAGMVCPHLARDPHPGSGVCVPMMAQGEALGLLHLKGLPALDQESPEHLPQRLDSREQLAVTAAAHIALALANLRLRETLRAQSIRDPLTGLFNRRYMMESLDRELRRAARSAQRLAAVILDIDLFKQFNDSYGHDAGDALLREVAALLQKGTRQEDFSCRHGGDEFVIIFTNISFAVAERRAREMRHAIRSLSIFHDGRYLRPPTVSLGAALYPDHAESAETLLRAADEALYRAKSSGRDRVVVGHTTESS